jgi:hypothetical protein
MCIFTFHGATSAQTVFCYYHSKKCPEDFPPDADVVVEGESITLHGTNILESDAHWYFGNHITRTWSTLDNAEVQAFASGVFDELFHEIGWKYFLKDTDTAFHVMADGNIIAVLSENTLHLLDIPSKLALSITYKEDVYVPTCTTPDGDRIHWARTNRKGFRVVRCFRRFPLARHHAVLRIIADPDFFKAETLEVLHATSPFDYEKQRYDIEHHLNPPEVWFNEMGKYGAMFELYILLDGTYAEDLEYGTFGPQTLRSISLHDRLVQLDLETTEYIDTSDAQQGSRFARSALLNILEGALLSAPAKWLLWIETGDDTTLIRNLSTLFTKEEKQ